MREMTRWWRRGGRSRRQRQGQGQGAESRGDFPYVIFHFSFVIYQSLFKGGSQGLQ